jgi:malate/lactate dehydrogenase
MANEPPFAFEKMTIVGGAGGLGASIAFYVGLSGIVKEIVLLDKNQGALATQEIDLRECFVGESPTKIRKGEWEDAEGSDLVFMAAAKTGEQVKSRNDYLFANLSLVRDTAALIKKHAPDAFLISVTAPVDAFVMVFQEELGFDRRKIMGFCINDTQRFKWGIGQALKIDPARTYGIVLGEHGESQAPIYSTVQVDDAPYELSKEEKEAAGKFLAEWYSYWQSQNSGRTTTWSSATGTLSTLKNLAGLKTHAPFMGSVMLEGEYGIKGVALGVPLKAGKGRWESIVELPLAPSEEENLQASARKVKEIFDLTKLQN